MNLEPGTAQMLQQMQQMDIKPFFQYSVEESRHLFSSINPRENGQSYDVTTSNRSYDVQGDSIPAIVIQPNQDSKGIIVYVHGGGFLLGEAEDFELFGKMLAQKTSCTVIIPNYRKGPEFQHPTAFNDAESVVKAVYAKKGDYVTNTSVPFILMGDSAGATIAAVLTSKSRNTADYNVDLQVLAYPLTQTDFNSECYTDPQNQLLVGRENMLFFLDNYIPNQADRESADFAMMNETDLSGMPPAVIITAEYDVLREDGKAYAKKLDSAGIPVVYKNFDGTIHAFLTTTMLPVCDQAISFIADSMKQVLSSTTV